MLDSEKHQLNLAVNEFVSSFPGDAFTEEEVIVAFNRAHADLITSTGVRPEQVERMIRYVLEVGQSEDAFAVAEADLEPIPIEVLNHFVSPHVRNLLQQADDKRQRAFELRNAERRKMDKRIGYIEEFIWDFSEQGALPWPKSIRRLGKRYEQLQAENATEYWMGAVDLLIAGLRRRCPHFTVAEALFAVLPRNIAIPRYEEERSENERTPLEDRERL